MTREEAIRELREDKALYETDNCHAGDGSPDGDLLEALDMAIEALRNEINCVKCVHYTERETDTGIKGECKMDTAHREDLISRQDAIDILDEFESDIEVGKRDSYKTHREKLLSVHSAYHLLCALADRECPFQGKEYAWCLTCPHISEEDRELVRKAINPRTGEWVDWLGKGNEWECSVCKCSIESHGSIAYRYCPMCGADMRGEEE